MRRKSRAIIAIGFLLFFITQASGNVMPAANPDHFVTTMNTPVSGNVLDNDVDPDIGDIIAVIGFISPLYGNLVLNEDGTFIYTPDEGFAGLDYFDYEISDGELSSVAPVVITITGGGPPPQLPDFTISAVKPVQVVWNSDIDGDDVNDLVAGKSTAVLVYVGIEGYENLNQNERNAFVEIHLNFDGVDLPRKWRTVTELYENNKVEFYPYDYFITTEKKKTIVAEVIPSIDEVTEDNNKEQIDVTVKETNGLHLVYYPVNGLKQPGILGDYGPLDMDDYSDTVKQGGTFIEATYPIAGTKFNNDEQDMKFYGSSFPLLGMLTDLEELWAIAEKLSITSVDKAVGIVPDDYFKYHLSEKYGTTGTFFQVNAALVQVNYWTAVAHEIAHTYGLRRPSLLPGEGEEYETNPNGANPAYGFWVNKETEDDPEKEISNGLCFMGKFHGEKTFAPGDAPIWIDEEDFAYLFQNFRVDTQDPPAVLLLRGIIFKDGTVQLGSLYMVENGIIDQIIPGDYSIEILDADEQVLVNIPFYTAFYAQIDFIGIVETDFAGFAFVIPYPENASRIRVQHDGNTLIEINPNSKLLHDAVDSIQEYGFVGNSEQRRKALHNKIDEIELKIKNNEIQDAVNKLRRDVRDKIEKWLVDGYQPQNPLQLSKNEILELVDNILSRFNTIWPGSVTNTEIAEPESDSVVSEEIIAALAEETQPVEDDAVDTGGEDAFDVEEAVGFILFETGGIISELDPESFNNEESAIELKIEMDFIFSMLDQGMYFESLILLENDILQRMDGCANIGKPDEDDWITSVEGHALLYPLVTEAIELLESLL